MSSARPSSPIASASTRCTGESSAAWVDVRESRTMNSRLDNQRIVRAARGTTLTAKSWLTEAPLRMLMNNLDPEVAEKPHELVVYGGIGRAARDWESYDRIVTS